ncbi:MAG TPA: hypothetical protein VLM38_22945 [Blastocatellia bacterium]|nr:hypothetical protein [Blastocatellia bacterium]
MHIQRFATVGRIRETETLSAIYALFEAGTAFGCAPAYDPGVVVVTRLRDTR